ncbi:NeuD/PglB/VioB family sugar acetyltransferase [Winogradskyella endarachnes]|uniref:Transferase n=1 Tax=Winogradskyella endarachnes TaxID=2681965 RepID=A0A6L6U4F6_9FLAO|nr:NeuD/PglB/VioB family sugar acetyltransferase [Winogradskyella endarachnes]MUU76955.1 transferase [Winogradskyella endarachnes]
MKNILIYGASGHAKMIVDVIKKNNSHNIMGFIDTYKPLGYQLSNYKVIGHREHLKQLSIDLNIEGIIIAIGDNFTRQKVSDNIRRILPNIQFETVVHPTATLAGDIIIEEGSVIMAKAVINAGAKVGKFCIINTASTLGHDSVMADYSSLASGVTIAGTVKIGFCSAICLRSIIIQNVEIGNNTVIGAGSLVLQSIGDLKLAYGNPVKIIKDRKVDSKYLS